MILKEILSVEYYVFFLNYQYHVYIVLKKRFEVPYSKKNSLKIKSLRYV